MEGFIDQESTLFLFFNKPREQKVVKRPTCNSPTTIGPVGFPPHGGNWADSLYIGEDPFPVQGVLVSFHDSWRESSGGQKRKA